MGRWKGPPKPSGEQKRRQLDLFAWAASAAAKLGRSREDVSASSQAGILAIIPCLLAIWTRAPADSSLPLLLIGTCVITVLLAFVIYGTRALQSRIERPGVAIFLQGGSLLIAGVLLLTCVSWWGLVEFRQYTQRREQLAKEQAAERKQGADQKAAAAREAECLGKREDAINKARRRQRAEKKRLDDCNLEFDSKFRPFQSAETFCKPAQDRFDAASRAVIFATSTVCSTGSIPTR